MEQIYSTRKVSAQGVGEKNLATMIACDFWQVLLQKMELKWDGIDKKNRILLFSAK